MTRMRAGLALTTILIGAGALSGCSPVREETTMYGLIGQIRATPGDREALARVLLDGTRDMPGCRSYVIAEDPVDADALWVTEVWESAEAHRASLALPGVQEAIRQGRPMIAGFGDRHETRPVGGHGLSD